MFEFWQNILCQLSCNLCAFQTCFRARSPSNIIQNEKKKWETATLVTTYIVFCNFFLIRFVSAKKKPKPAPVSKKMLIFSLPTKATTKELRITLSLFVVVVCHICLTIPQVCAHSYSILKKSWAFGFIFLKFKYLDNGLINYLINSHNSDTVFP